MLRSQFRILPPPRSTQVAVIAFALLILFIAGLMNVPETEARSIPRFRIKETEAREQFLRGWALFNEGSYVAAREFFYKALSVYPGFHTARRYLGDSYYYSGDWEAALEQWEYLDESSDGAYPGVSQRSEIMRFFLNRFRNPGDYIFLDSLTRDTVQDALLRSPADVQTDAAGNVYVLSRKSADLVKISTGGDLLWKTSGTLLERWKGPAAFYFTGKNFAVSDYTGDSVYILDENGIQQRVIGSGLKGPAGVCIRGSTVYIADSVNRRIVRYTLEGEFLSEFSAPDDDMRNPYGIACDTPAGIYVTDSERAAVYQFDEDHNPVRVITDPLLSVPRQIRFRDGELVIADEKKGVLIYNIKEDRFRSMPEMRFADSSLYKPSGVMGADRGKEGIIYAAASGSDSVDRYIQKGLRTSNLEVRIQRIDLKKFPTVAVYFTVRNRLGQNVSGISRRDFFIYENDRRIGKIRSDNMDQFQNRLNLVLMRENSSFFTDNYAVHLAALMKPVLDPLRISDRVSVIRSSREVRTVYQGLQRREILRHLAEADDSESPNSGKALYEAVTGLNQALGPRHIIYTVSGKISPDDFIQYTPMRIRQYARSNGIRIHIISFGAGDSESESIYRDIAEFTGGNYYRATDEDSVRGIYDRLKQDSDERYILTYSTIKDEGLSGRYVDLRVEVNYLGTSGFGDAGFFVP